MKYYFSLIFLLVFLMEPMAQQLPLFTQYRDYQGFINPASVHKDYYNFGNNLSFGASYRQQWANINPAPKTQMLQGEYLLNTKQAVNLITGAYLIHDDTDPTGFTGFYGRIAGLISPDPKLGGFSVGLNIGMVQYRINTQSLKLQDESDISKQNDLTKIYPDVGMGIFYYRNIQKGLLENDLIYGGISIPQLFGLDLNFSSAQEALKTKRVRHYYALLGWQKNFSKTTFLESSIWFKYVQNAPVNTDFNVRLSMNNNFWLGLGGSTAKNVHVEAGVILGKNIGFNHLIKIGYSFDRYFNNNFGPEFGNTHEVSISYSLNTINKFYPKVN